MESQDTPTNLFMIEQELPCLVKWWPYCNNQSCPALIEGHEWHPAISAGVALMPLRAFVALLAAASVQLVNQAHWFVLVDVVHHGPWHLYTAIVRHGRGQKFGDKCRILLGRLRRPEPRPPLLEQARTWQRCSMYKYVNILSIISYCNEP